MQHRAESDSTVDAIARALAVNHDWVQTGADVEWIQTHISHVFVVGNRVYKLRKSVRPSFLDFGSRSARNEDCEREIALNRRLAPDVYLGVAPVIWDGGSARLGPIAESIADEDVEHVVVMRRLPAGHDALSLLESNRLGAQHLEAVADRLSRFHGTEVLGRPAPWTSDEWCERIARPILDSLVVVAESGIVEVARIEKLETQVRSQLASLRSQFEIRRREGRAVNAHGDLHLDHIWFEDEERLEPLLIDCLEFSEELRHIDCASEVAFLAMDLDYRGRKDLAEWFLAAYAMRSDDYGLFSVVDLFSAYRALVRAKVAAIATSQPTLAQPQREAAAASVERHTTLAAAQLESPEPGGIVLLCGTVGSGKSTVARYLGQQQCGIPIASDRVRKALSGIAATERTRDGIDEGIYEASATESVYRAMLERAQPIVDSGRTAILDASYSLRSQRDLARAWASKRGLRARLLEVRCKHQTAIKRLERRSAQGCDPSDAGPEFLETSESRFEKPEEWPTSDYRLILTD